MQDSQTTQTSARTFGSYSVAERGKLLALCRELMSNIKQDLAVDTFLSYGTLLGVVRDGALFANDTALDVGFLSDEASSTSNLRVAERLVEYLIARGYEITSESNGHFRAALHGPELSLCIVFFAAWSTEKHFYHYFAVRGEEITGELLPLGALTVDGVEFPVPRQPAVLLAAIYGDAWRTPDPTFRYRLTEADWAPFQFLFTNGNQNFWDSYYANQLKNRVWVDTPSGFANLVGERSAPGRLLDIGCGNGRDGLYFATLGHTVTLADYSAQALQVCRETALRRGLSITTEQVSVSSFPDVAVFKREHAGTFDVVYARFFLHAVDEVSQRNLLELANCVLAEGGCFELEFRCAPRDGTRQQQIVYENGEHYRRMVDVDAFEQEAAELGFVTEYSETGFGMAKYKSEDPLITRCTLRKVRAL